MRRRPSIILFLLFLPLLAITARGEEPAKLSPPLYGVEGKCLLQADFASAKLDDDWKNVKGKWEVKDGALSGVQVPEQNHAAVLRHELPLHDFIAQFTFKFDGGKAIKLVLNKNTVHIATVSVWLNQLTIDKQPEKDSGKKLRRIDAQNVKLSPDEWHTVVVEVIGSTIVATVDSSLVVFGTDDGLDIDKSDFDFAANGSTAIKSVKFCKASGPADNEAAGRKLQALREATK